MRAAEDPLVVTNDAMDIGGIRQLLEAGKVHNIVISPGPGTPEHHGDVGERCIASCSKRSQTNHASIHAGSLCTSPPACFQHAR